MLRTIISKTINPWNIPTLNLKDELLDTNEDFSEKAYSIFNTNHVFRGAKELAELLQVFPTYRSKDILNLISFRPERAAYHDLIVDVNLRFKISDEQQLQGLVFQLYERLKSSNTYKKLIESAYEQRHLIESMVTEMVKEQTHQQEYSLTENRILQKLNEFAALLEKPSFEFGRFEKGYTAQKALIALVCDAIYKEQILPEINHYISDLVTQVLQEHPDLSLQARDCEERLTVMIAGGQASGKSSAIEILQSSLKKHDLTFDDFIKLNADNFKPLVLQPGSVNKYLYSQLAQPEATHVRILLQRQVEKMINAQKAPNLYVDQVFLGPKKLNFSLKGQGVIAIVVSTSVEQAVERSFMRGQQVTHDQGRFEHTAGVLAGHKGVAVNFFQHIMKYVGSNLSVILYDNNVTSNQPPQEVMKLDFAVTPAIATIYDVEKLKLFIKKITINTEAKNGEEVYLANSNEQTEILYRKFLQDLEEHKVVVYGKSTSASPSLREFAIHKLVLQDRSSSLNIEKATRRRTRGVLI